MFVRSAPISGTAVFLAVVFAIWPRWPAQLLPTTSGWQSVRRTDHRLVQHRISKHGFHQKDQLGRVSGSVVSAGPFLLNTGAACFNSNGRNRVLPRNPPAIVK